MPLSDEQKMLVGLARAYVECQRQFGMPGTETYWEFPLIQGYYMRVAVDRIASVPGDLAGIKIAEVVRAVEAAAEAREADGPAD